MPGPGQLSDARARIKAIYATGQFDDVAATCELSDGKAALTFTVKERPLLGAVDVTGTDRVSRNSVRDKVDLLVGKAVDPAQVAHAVKRIDSLYQASGYYLARGEARDDDGERPGQPAVPRRRGTPARGLRRATSRATRRCRDKTVVGAMATKPEGFFWWRKGEFDNDKFAGDIGEKIPALYASQGIHRRAGAAGHASWSIRERGKALVDIKVAEGPRYRIGSFEVTGSQALLERGHRALLSVRRPADDAHAAR